MATWKSLSKSDTNLQAQYVLVKIATLFSVMYGCKQKTPRLVL